MNTLLSNPLYHIDAYKTDHRNQYPEGTEMVFSNMTPRSTRVEGIEGIRLFGLQYYIIRYLIDDWQEHFFDADKDDVVGEYEWFLESYGLKVDVTHIAELHDLGFLPLEIRSLPEGALVPIGVPAFVLWNTIDKFSWLTNYLETAISTAIWGMSTSATTAKIYRDMLMDSMESTGGPTEMVDFMAHDFSCRGMFGIEAAAMSGAGHLTSFKGSDTLPAMRLLQDFYPGHPEDLVGCSVPATEHSVMCMGQQEGEEDTFRRLITETYPSGIVSIVSDTWDYWKVWTDILPKLKDEIMARDGTVVIRPDSGDPVKIICGDPEAPVGSPAHKGSYMMAWELFGGTQTDKMYAMLDSHIGLIYGDSITPERCREILARLKSKGFVPNMVFGVGSFSYQHVTRDTHGFAIKATAGRINGEDVEIFKDPKTASSDTPKKSAKGLIAVYEGPDGYVMKDQATWDEVLDCAFEPVFLDGQIQRYNSLQEIRDRIAAT